MERACWQYRTNGRTGHSGPTAICRRHHGPEIRSGFAERTPRTLPAAMRRLPLVLVTLALVLAGHRTDASADTTGVSLTGTLSLTERGVAVNEAADAVVWFVPAGGVAPPAPTRAEVLTVERRFIPRVTVVPAGSEVWFPNSD